MREGTPPPATAPNADEPELTEEQKQQQLKELNDFFTSAGRISQETLRGSEANAEASGYGERERGDEEVETEEGEVVRRRGKRIVRRAGKDVEIDGDKAYLLLYDKQGEVRGRKQLPHGYEHKNNPDRGYFANPKWRHLAGVWYWNNNDKEFVRERPADADAAAANRTDGVREGGGDDTAAEEARLRELRALRDQERAAAEAAERARAEAEAVAARNLNATNPTPNAAASAAALARARTRAGLDSTNASTNTRRWYDPIRWMASLGRGIGNLFRRQPTQPPATPPTVRPIPTSFEAGTLEDAQRMADAIASGAVDRAPRNKDLLRSEAYIALQQRRGLMFENPEQRKQAVLTMAKLDRQHNKLPQWARVGLSLGILAGGMAASSVVVPMMTASVLLATVAKGGLALGAAFANNKLLNSRPMSKHRALFSTLTAVATFGLVQFADEAVAGAKGALEWAGYGSGARATDAVRTASSVPIPEFKPPVVSPELSPQSELANPRGVTTPVIPDGPPSFPESIVEKTGSGDATTGDAYTAAHGAEIEGNPSRKVEIAPFEENNPPPNSDEARPPRAPEQQTPPQRESNTERRQGPPVEEYQERPRRRGGSAIPDNQYRDLLTEPPIGSKEWWPWYDRNRGVG